MDFVVFITSNWWRIIITAVTAYLLGSINTAVIVTKVTTGKDIRSMGSGNAGFTNVLRSVGKVPAVFTIICDFLKGVAAVLIGGLIFWSIPSNGSEILTNEYIAVGKYLAGVCCILGHSYPLYFHFKGGKGVVTAAALMVMVDWRVFLLIIGTFLIIFLATKTISIASISCAALYGFYTLAILLTYDYFSGAGYSLTYVIFSTAAALLIGVFVIIKHKDNIKRILRGEEKKITAKKK
ncbi:MAG: glycerol-3-phosphate 1-O-acyltransferase PlsY [Oscillospiraceae bacterium]|nr:glycerol-3-phosphate 1-O-acyltransferase PlsY [Oscillospiraceae bacterium]